MRPNSCRRDGPCRRATSDTTEPGTNFSSRMRAFWPVDQRLRPVRGRSGAARRKASAPMRADRIRQGLHRGRLDAGVIGGAEHGDEDLRMTV
jgi:hypothetical protein